MASCVLASIYFQIMQADESLQQLVGKLCQAIRSKMCVPLDWMLHPRNRDVARLKQRIEYSNTLSHLSHLFMGVLLAFFMCLFLRGHLVRKNTKIGCRARTSFNTVLFYCSTS